ncbi:NPCBM/NEW2 domain-containing protein [Phyllobacterium lublinensis]|uniref:NPCBM/NEW2 domain-containing protein n=1 Tax=Phyllobacterium lublinensis TaxID=2875708 RepID=UPI001CCDA0DA|nr:NPCBM/NEW2 domain-containing protein [Phyllobacterium sp. 2063]MBZ9653952.1 NPCBM/NEW2 domain-containing protein [Phyllobacterium sp. 2063]
MNFRLLSLAGMAFLAACNGSESSRDGQLESTFAAEQAEARKAAEDEIAAFKKGGINQATTEIDLIKQDMKTAKAELDRLKAAGNAKAKELEQAEERYKEVARKYAGILQELGRTPEAVEVLKNAGLTQEASNLMSQIVIKPQVPYEPFPTLYKVTFDDGAKGLPAPKSAPMGWNAWNTFRCDVTEATILEIADTLIESGMAKAGYTSVNLDDCWSEGRAEGGGLGRDGDNKLRANSRFPSGIKALAEKIHAKGLKLGIYSGGNNGTCQGYPGSLGFEAIDARTFAEWKVDYVKYDDCGGPDNRLTFVRMRDALAKSGREIFYSGNFNNFANGFNSNARTFDLPPAINMDVTTVAHTARVGDDIQPNFDSIKALIRAAGEREAYSTPGFWNDPDMLQVGRLPTLEENKTHFAMWAMLAGPLLAGNDIRTQSDDTLKILSNADIIAVNQDRLNIQASVVREDVIDRQVWSKPLEETGARAVALLNMTDTAGTISVQWTDVALADAPAKVRNLSTGTDVGDAEMGYSTVVPAHGVVVLKVTGKEIGLPSGRSILSDQQPIYQVNGWGPVEKDQSNGEAMRNDGTPLQIGDEGFEKGLGVAARSQVIYRTDGRCSDLSVHGGVDRFYATKSVPEKRDHGNVSFEIWGDGNLLAASGVMTPADGAKRLTADLTHASIVRLIVKPGGDYVNYDYADWANPEITCH